MYETFQVIDDLPDILIAQGRFVFGHACSPGPIFYYPKQLTVRQRIHRLFASKVSWGWHQPLRQTTVTVASNPRDTFYKQSVLLLSDKAVSLAQYSRGWLVTDCSCANTLMELSLFYAAEGRCLMRHAITRETDSPRLSLPLEMQTQIPSLSREELSLVTAPRL